MLFLVLILDRIEDAYWHLRKFAKLESVANAHAKKPRFEPVDKENGSEYNVSLSANKETTDTSTDCSSSQEKNLLQTVSFQQENFVKSRHSAKKSYDTILWYFFMLCTSNISVNLGKNKVAKSSTMDGCQLISFLLLKILIIYINHNITTNPSVLYLCPTLQAITPCKSTCHVCLYENVFSSIKVKSILQSGT